MLKRRKFQKKINSPTFLDRLIILLILIIYISISHVFLPMVKKNDFLFFFQWNMFSTMPSESIYDITWDGGRSFLFRDHRKKAKAAGITLYVLFYLLLYSNAEKLKKHFYQALLNFCSCENLSVFKLKGSLSEHILYKKQLKILDRKEL